MTSSSERAYVGTSAPQAALTQDEASQLNINLVVQDKPEQEILFTGCSKRHKATCRAFMLEPFPSAAGYANGG